MSAKTGIRIKALRDKNGLTQEMIAKKIGVATQTIFKYEKGIVTNIPLTTVESLSSLFHVHPAYIAGWIDTPNLNSNSPSLTGWNNSTASKSSSTLTAAEPGDVRDGYLTGNPGTALQLLTEDEMEHMHKYHVIPTDGKKRVDNVLDYEYDTFREAEAAQDAEFEAQRELTVKRHGKEEKKDEK